MFLGVYWERDDEWFDGKVLHYDAEEEQYTVHYDDGETHKEVASHINQTILLSCFAAQRLINDTLGVRWGRFRKGVEDSSRRI